MIYHNYIGSATSAYDRSKHVFSDFSRCDWSPRLSLRDLSARLSSGILEEALRDPQGCTIVLPIGFVCYSDLFSCFWKQLVETGRISEIEYIKNVPYFSSEEFKAMSDEEKAQNSMDCVRIQLADSPRSEIGMRIREEDDYHPVPYADVRESLVLAPDRYPLLKNGSEERQSPLSEHMEIVEYTGNAPDIMIMKGDLLLGIEDLPAVLEQKERPKYALKIDLGVWLPEYLRIRLFAVLDSVIYGTIPGTPGEEQRLRRILALKMTPPPLWKQAEKVFLFRNGDGLSVAGQEFPLQLEENVSSVAGKACQVGVMTTGAVLSGLLFGPFGALASLAIGLGTGAAAAGVTKLIKDRVEYEDLEDRFPKETGIEPEPHDDAAKRRLEMERIWRESAERRLKLDSSISTVMRNGENTSQDDLRILSGTIRSIRNDTRELLELFQRLNADKKNDLSVFYRLDDDEMDKLDRMIEVVFKMRDLLAKDSFAPLEKTCPECGSFLVADDLAAGTGLFPNISNTFLSILNSCFHEYTQKEKENARNKAAEALKRSRKAEQASKEAEQASKEAEIRASERQAVLYEMSHHIKNLVVSVIDPLENMAGTVPDNSKHVLADAINGANMIRQIVFFITNSYRSTVEDFIYDLSNPEDNPQTMESLFESTLRASVANMFDKQTHGKYMRAFFPSKDFFTKAKNDWYATRDLSGVIRFMNDHMNIRTDIALDPFRSIRIGDAKGSATNLAILFNELIMNMMKALAFVEKDRREFHVNLERDGEMILFRFVNTSRSAGTMSHGYGKTIVTNITKGLGGILSSQTSGNQYSVEMKLPFFKTLS